MASYKKINNKWTVVFDMPSVAGQRAQKRLSGYNSRREAELAYIAFKGENKQIKPSGQYPFGAVFERYMSYQETRVKESSFVSIKHCFDLWLLPYFKTFSIENITAKDIAAWQADMSNRSQKALSFKYKNKIFMFLKGFLNYCRDIEEIIQINPVKKQLKFIDTAIKTEMLIYSPEEYNIFRSAISKPQDIIIFDLLYFTGARKGELLALQWQDFKENSISITKTYTRKTKDGKWKLTPPKSKNSVRKVLLPDFLIAELKDYRAAANDAEYIIGSEFPNNERYLDLARNKYVEASGVKRIRIHDFRHSHVSYLLSENIDVMTIAARVGDNVETILKTYAHLMPNKQFEMLKKLDSVLLN